MATSSSRRSFQDTASFKSSVPSGPPPSYSRHHNDELLPPTNFRVRRRLSMPVFARPALRADPSLMLQVLSAPGPLHLTIDNGMIYPPPPSNALYHLPRVLTWSGNEIFLFRSLPSSTRHRNGAQPHRDLALYTMRRTPFTNEVALIPKREGLNSAVMHGRRSLLSGMTWEVEVRGQVKLRYAKGKWRDHLGHVVAEEKAGEREEITIVGQNLEVFMKDLIVAAWATRMWQGTGRISLARSLMSGKGKPFSPSGLVRNLIMSTAERLLRYRRPGALVKQDPLSLCSCAGADDTGFEIFRLFFESTNTTYDM